MKMNMKEDCWSSASKSACNTSPSEGDDDE
jgi:hypothetical protein